MRSEAMATTSTTFPVATKRTGGFRKPIGAFIRESRLQAQFLATLGPKKPILVTFPLKQIQ
jgi:hypothetical protein